MTTANYDTIYNKLNKDVTRLAGKSTILKPVSTFSKISVIKPVHIYSAIPIVLFIIIRIWNPIFLTTPDENQQPKINYIKILALSIILAALIIGLYIYRYEIGLIRSN